MSCALEVNPTVSLLLNMLIMVFSTALLQDWLGDDAAKRHRREIHFPSGRFGEAVEQAQAALFLASDESSFVNGTDFVVDGGMTRVSIMRTATAVSDCLFTFALLTTCG